MVPVVDVVEIGNGGGSIAWVDDFDKLHVGPQSAARCPARGLRRGGREATTTDANLASGGSTRSTSAGSTPTWTQWTRALRAVAEQLQVDTAEAARGIVRIANNNMVNALKLIS